MARNSLRALSCAILIGLGFPAWGSDNSETKQKYLLAVQVALERGHDCVQRGDYENAVSILEKQIPYIDGNKRYLAVLRDAYHGYVQQLVKAGQTEKAKKYRGFLEILEPPTRMATSAGNSSTPVAATSDAPREVAPLASSRPVHRGKIEDSDPFDPGNAAGASGRNILARADRAYDERQYAAAARFYAEAETTEPGCAESSKERWAYCKLFVVAQELNRPTGARAASDLEREIQQALRMAPRLEQFGKGLLARLRDNDEESTPAIEIKHSPRGEMGYAIAETSNVRVFHNFSREQAEKIVQVAESTRVNMTRKWFGVDAKPWTPRCDVYVHANGQVYASKTGAPAGSPGHSTISLEAGRVVVRRVDIRGDDPNFMVGVLPHEVTHVVLAGNFGSHHVPRWADEGMAVLSEPRHRVELHLRNLPKHHRDNSLFGVAELMKLNDYPEPRRVGAFYAQSVSVVDFLCRKKDPLTFAKFLREALDGQYEVALQRHYGYRSFADLEQEWRAHAISSTSGVATVTEKRSAP